MLVEAAMKEQFLFMNHLLLTVEMMTTDLLTSLQTFFRNDGARKIQKSLFRSQSPATCLIIKIQIVPDVETLIF